MAKGGWLQIKIKGIKQRLEKPRWQKFLKDVKIKESDDRKDGQRRSNMHIIGDPEETQK